MANKVLILEVHAKASLPVIESCKAMGLNVIAGSYRKHCCGMYSKAVDRKVIYPQYDKNPDKFIVFMLDFLKNNTIDMMFPVGDVMTDIIAKNQEQIRKYTKILLPSYDIFVQGRNKVGTLKAAEKAGCPIPLTWYPDDEPLEKIIEKIPNYPVLVKPAISAGARGITFCYDKNDILNNFDKVQKIYGQSFVQEYVPQDGMQYKVDAVMDEQQELYAGVVYSKLRYYPVDGGSSVLNKTEHRPDILEQAVNVMKELKWVGLCDFDFITDPRDGIVKLMEINPRFPESYRTVEAGGVDMTKIIYQLAIGQKPEPQLQYKENQYNRFLFGDIMWFLKTKENRFKVKPSFFRFWGKDMYYQLIRKNDLGPLWGYIRENLAMVYDKKLRTQRLRLKGKPKDGEQ
ncbi:MAG: Carbamoylphosphate synthase large subunit [Candidatus Uhrbacteria bacterium GW2011_GWF2_39_13]|uniref:Carbamoylphosphate synthase large subunit n=1 Tax=Candidatus Uhrbacteria bacterium GW2011_GWF2_39_13 TaxID=1618995 RepID=A0A0G0MG16_9BACT|nr:MAG: Carbamoylphosphate synthase large subunit [Candidatus Uhrbacteria bacterium GW2011_GWF2_39_13]